MEESKSYFKKIDDGVFKVIDDFQESSSYNKLTDSLDSLDDTSKNFLGFLIGFIVITLPLAICIYLFLRNSGYRDDLEIKEETFAAAREFLATRASIDKSSGALVSNSVISSVNQVRSTVNGHLENIGIQQSAVQIQNFSQENINASVIQSKANVVFKEISTEELMKFINLMSLRSRFKIDYLKIQRVPTNGLLNGTFGVMHFGKLSE